MSRNNGSSHGYSVPHNEHLHNDIASLSEIDASTTVPLECEDY